MTTFDHEKLDVYRVSIEFVALADGLTKGFPAGNGYLADQLHRAGISIALNIAEGAGEFSKREKARFYRMARRSATECSAILDVCRVLHLADVEPLNAGREMLLRVVSMLIKMVRNIDQSGTE
ncbi:MAG: four helix bundle protein [Gemmataceae bacterium]|nr:four helix bundle protein [Gemmataceae bacterium]